MDRHNNTHSLVESSILTSIALVLILMTVYLPVFYIIGVFLWPIPITLMYIRHGVKFSILSLIVTFIITALVAGPISAVGLVVIYGLLGVVLGYCITSKRSAVISIIIMAVAAFLSTMVIYKLFASITGVDIISQVINVLNKSYSESQSMYTKMGVSKEAFTTIISTLRTILPSVFILYSIVLAFVSYLLTQKILKRFKYNIPVISPISEWYIPSKVSFGIILIFGISFLLLKSGIQNGDSYFVNANILFNYTFTINALAFVVAFLKKKNIKKPFNWVVIIFCILPPISTYLFFLGVFDYILDYRKLDPSRKRPDRN
jgi:uncharacterized protein YybS (DUF2232 family)